jgi:hypothetical protein
MLLKQDISYTVDSSAFAEAKALLDPVGYVIAAQAAIGRTLVTGVAATARIVGRTLNLKIGDIKETIRTDKPSFDKLEGSIAVDRKPVPLGEFPSTQTKRGVSVKVWKDGGREVLKSTFKATMSTGHQGVFERLRGAAGTIDATNSPSKFVIGGKGGKLYIKLPEGSRNRDYARAAPSGRVWRLPIVERFGPTVVGAITGSKSHAGAEETIAVDLSATLQKNINSQINRVLNNPRSIAGLRGAARQALDGN